MERMGGMGGGSAMRKGSDREGEGRAGQAAWQAGQAGFTKTEGVHEGEEEESAGYNAAEALESVWWAVQHVPEGSARELRILHMARIYCYAVAGRVEEAEKAFAAMEQAGHLPTTAAYNCLLLAYTRSHRMHHALSLLSTMRASHMLPDATTYHHLITGALNNEDTDGAVSLLLQAAAAAAAGHPWSWTRGSASPRVDAPNPVVDALGEGCGMVERLAEAGEMERVERVVSEVGRGMYAMDAGMYNLVLRAVLRGARRRKEGKGVGEAGHEGRGVEGGEDKGNEAVEEEDSKRDGDDGGDSCGNSGGGGVTEHVGVEDDGYERRVEEGARRVLRLLQASKIRPNVQTRIVLESAGLVRLLEEEGLSGTVPQ
ncbi:unnamed protein product [Closterium sp. Yama58-4]|nr:unnamed protein product [Closterium sp. Yama58-4]